MATAAVALRVFADGGDLFAGLVAQSLPQIDVGAADADQGVVEGSQPLAVNLERQVVGFEGLLLIGAGVAGELLVAGGEDQFDGRTRLDEIGMMARLLEQADGLDVVAGPQRGFGGGEQIADGRGTPLARLGRGRQQRHEDQHQNRSRARRETTTHWRPPIASG